MYSVLLSIHSYNRWLVLSTVLASVFLSASAHLRRREWVGRHETVARTTVGVVHLQLVLGLFLYSQSPLVQMFVGDMGLGMKDRTLRFFGMEHVAMMFLAVVLIQFGRIWARRAKSDSSRHQRTWVTALLALVLMGAAIPWPGSAVERPLLRGMRERGANQGERGSCEIEVGLTTNVKELGAV